MLITAEQITDDKVTIHLQGDFDAAAAGKVRQTLSDCLRTGVNHIGVDCNGVTFMDSGGLRAVLASHKLAEGLGVELRLVSPSLSVIRLLEMTGLLDRLVETRSPATSQ